MMSKLGQLRTCLDLTTTRQNSCLSPPKELGISMTYLLQSHSAMLKFPFFNQSINIFFLQKCHSQIQQKNTEMSLDIQQIQHISSISGIYIDKNIHIYKHAHTHVHIYVYISYPHITLQTFALEWRNKKLEKTYK